MNQRYQQSGPISSRLRASLFSGSVALFGGLMVSNIIAYLYQMLMARMLSPAEYGVLVTLTSVSYVLLVVMRTFQAWVIKAVASDAEAGHARGVFLAALASFAPIGLVLLLLHWLAGSWVADFLHLGTTTPVIALGLYTFSSFLVPAPRGVLLGLRRMHAGSLVHILEPLIRLLAGVLLVWWGFGASGGIGGFAVGNLLTFVAATGLIWPLLRQRTPAPAIRFGGLDRYAVFMLSVNTCLMIIGSVDQVAVKHFFSDHVAGNYAVAFLLGRIISMTTLALGWVIFTRTATLPPDDPGHARVLLKGMALMGTIAVALACGYLAMPALAVRLMGGAQYTSATSYVGLVGVEMTLFAFVYIQAYFQLSIKRMQALWPLLIATVLEIALLARYHASVQQILFGLIGVMAALLVCVSVISWAILRQWRQPAANRSGVIEAVGVESRAI